MVVDVKPIVSAIDTKTKEIIESHHASRRPALAVVLVGEREDSLAYIKHKKKKCELLGIDFSLYQFSVLEPYAKIVQTIFSLNADKNVDGIIMQMPLPHEFVSHNKAIGEDVLSALPQLVVASKDVDGLCAENIGKLLLADKSGFIPATAQGVMAILHAMNYPFAGKSAVVVGRSILVGKPVAQLLLQQDMAVSIVHSKVSELRKYTTIADVLVVAAGKENLITKDMVKEGAFVIDVGMNTNTQGNLVGDVDFVDVENKAGYITKVPGGVGPLTVSFIAHNVAKAYQNNTKTDE